MYHEPLNWPTVGGGGGVHHHIPQNLSKKWGGELLYKKIGRVEMDDPKMEGRGGVELGEF